MSVGKKKRSFLVLAQSMLLSQILVLHQRMNFVRDAVLDSTTKSWSRRRAKNVRRRPVSLFLVCIFKKLKKMDVTLFPQEEVYKELYNNLEILPAPRTILEPMLDCIEEEMEDDLEEEELVFISSNGNKKKKKKKKKGKKNANVTDFSIEIPSDLVSK